MAGENLKAFAITQNKGFRITFKNGITASVQFGTTNYCDARDYSIGAFDAPMRDPRQCWDSDTAEIAAWDKTGKWITKEIIPDLSDEVKGWVTPEEVLEFLINCATYK